MKILKPRDVNNLLYYLLGAVLLVLNCMRHRLLGYRNPRPSSFAEVEKSIDYDFKIVKRWKEYLSGYLKEENPFKDKVILELGVGPDLGTGVILLAEGAKKYIALDVNNLARSVPVEFYGELFDRLHSDKGSDIEYLSTQLERFQRGEDSKISYIVDKDFRITEIKEEVDLIITQVAFEHFDDVGQTIKEISNTIKKGGILYSHVDMKTHSRWIQDRDPLNIYRYGDVFWKIFKFKGSPNRVRMPQYKKYLEMNNWSDTVMEPRTVLEKEYANKVINTLSKRFRDFDVPEMYILSFILMARKK